MSTEISEIDRRKRAQDAAYKQGYKDFDPNKHCNTVCQSTSTSTTYYYRSGWIKAQQEYEELQKERCPYCNSVIENTIALKRCTDTINCGYHIHPKG